MDKKELGERIRNERESKNITVQELANYLGVAQSFVSNVEAGEKIFSLKNYLKISTFLDKSIDYLLTGIDSEKNENNNHLSEHTEKYGYTIEKKVIHILEKKDEENQKLINWLQQQLNQRNEEINKILSILPEITKEK